MGVQLDHERLDVYHLALDFLVMANGVIEGLPRGRSHLADQFTRASTSIVLNLSEGAGKLSKPDKRRYYLTPYPMHRRPPLPPAACWWARLMVLSRLCHSSSRSL